MIRPVFHIALRQAIEALAPTLPGFQPTDRCLRHVELVLDVKPTTIVEIGVYGGRSLIPQAMALQHLGNGKIYGIDPWRTDIAVKGVTEGQQMDWTGRDLPRVHEEFINKVYELHLEHFIVPIRTTSADAEHLFNEIDILHIDGSHAEADALADCEAYVPLVRLGGYIWFDDSDFDSTQRAVDYLNDCAKLVADYGYYRLYQV